MRIFISYKNNSDPDVDYATSLFQLLVVLGHTAFRDEPSLETGESINARVTREIDECDIFVCFLGDNYLGSLYCIKELSRASKKHKRILPFVLPTGLSEDLRFTELDHILGDARRMTLDGRRNSDLLKILANIEQLPFGNEVSDSRASSACGFLQRYRETEEPPLAINGCSTSMSFRRGYNLLLYMFHYEKFDRFRAFDLAAHRWEELVNDDETQTVNLSSDILVKIENLLREGRCCDFRRLLVVPESKLAVNSVREALKLMRAKEQAWTEEIGNGVVVETRVLVFHPAVEPIRRRIADLCDFALFLNQDDKMAIVETTLNEPCLDHPNPQMQVEADATRLSHLETSFDELWSSSSSVESLLRGRRKR